MEFFNEHAVGFAIFCALVAIGFGLGLTWWLLKQPAGDARMQEIARAIRFLKQYEAVLVQSEPDAATRRIKAWQTWCHVLFASSEFVTVE